MDYDIESIVAGWLKMDFDIKNILLGLKELMAWLPIDAVKEFFIRIFHEPYTLGMFVGGALSVLVFGHLLNKLLTYLLLGDKISTFGIVKTPPKLSRKQIALLKETLLWWNYQCDKWYFSQPSCVDDALKGRRINLIDIQRLGDATCMGYLNRTISNKMSKEDKRVFTKLRKVLAEVEKEALHELENRKLHDMLIGEMDSLNKQLRISFFAAIAALASAVATISLAVMTYFNNPC